MPVLRSLEQPIDRLLQGVDAHMVDARTHLDSTETIAASVAPSSEPVGVDAGFVARKQVIKSFDARLAATLPEPMR